ncbi:hypothetical protein Gjalp_gp47, partial [Pelagibacter phage Gjalp EXVC020P]
MYLSIYYYEVGKLTPLWFKPDDVKGILKLPLPRLFFIAVFVLLEDVEVD